MKKIFTLTLLIFTLFSSHSQKTYFPNYQLLADSLETVYKIPSAVILAVAYYESGGGKSRVALLLNNHFGIVGSNNLLKTHGIKSRYKYYPSVMDSYIGFCKLVSNKKYYTNLVENNVTDNKKWISSIASAGYAQNAQKWTSSMLNVIRIYDLK